MKFSEGFINLTPHEIALFKDIGKPAKFPPSGILARVAEKTQDAGPIYGTMCKTKTYSGIEGLPEPSPGTYFIVSSLVFERTDRPDIVCPETGIGAVREGGRVVGTKWFLRK